MVKEKDEATNSASSRNAAGPSSNKRRKTHKQKEASRTPAVRSSPRSGGRSNPPKARSCSPPSSRLRSKTPAKKKPDLQKLAMLHERNEYGQTPLHVAIQNRREAAVRSLIAHGAHLEAADNAGYTALSYAANSGCVGCVSALVDAGASVLVSAIKWTPLYDGAFCGHAECIKLLAERHGYLNAKTCDRQTLLHWAAMQGHLPFTKTLVEIGADLNARDDYGSTLLAKALRYDLYLVQQYLESVGGTV